MTTRNTDTTDTTDTTNILRIEGSVAIDACADGFGYLAIQENGHNGPGRIEVVITKRYR